MSVIEQIAQYFEAQEYELGRQLAKGQNISLENVAEHILEKYIPKKWNRHLPIRGFYFEGSQLGKKLLNEYAVIACFMGPFYTWIHYESCRKVKHIFRLKLGINSYMPDWLDELICEHFSITIKQVSRSFPKRFLRAYNDAWNLCKREIIRCIANNA